MQSSVDLSPITWERVVGVHTASSRVDVARAQFNTFLDSQVVAIIWQSTKNHSVLYRRWTKAGQRPPTKYNARASNDTHQEECECSHTHLSDACLPVLHRCMRPCMGPYCVFRTHSACACLHCACLQPPEASCDSRIHLGVRLRVWLCTFQALRSASCGRRPRLLR